MTEVVLLVKRKKNGAVLYRLLYSHTHGSIMFKHTYMKYKREEEAVGVEGVRWSRVSISGPWTTIRARVVDLWF